MSEDLLEKKYTKGQVIEGLYAYFAGYNRYLSSNEKVSSSFPEHNKAPKSFFAKVKKLLDLDRLNHKDGFIFFDDEGVGQGGLEYFNDFQVVLMGFAVDSLYKGFKQSEVLWVTRKVKERMLETFEGIHKDKQILLKDHGRSYYKDDLYSTGKFYRDKLDNFIYLIIDNFEVSSPETHEELRKIRYDFLNTSNLRYLLERLDKSTSCVIFDFINLSLVDPQIVRETPVPQRGRPSQN